MSPCGESKERIHLYVDNELTPPEALEFERHLVECAACRAEYQRVRAVADVIRGAHPVYDVPEEAAGRARALIERTEQAQQWRWLAVAASVTLVVALGALGAWGFWHSRTPDFPAFAADIHLRYARSALPLDIVSADPDVLSEWLHTRLPFHVDLPDYPVLPGEEKPYRLVGARLLQFGGGDAGYLVYEMGGKPISLLIASTPEAASTGGETYRSGRLVFHFYQHKGLEIISWTDHDLHYCLVTEVATAGAGSCVICHGGAGERQMFENLTPQRRQ